MLSHVEEKKKPDNKLLKLTARSVKAIARAMDCTPVEMLERLAKTAETHVEKQHVAALAEKLATAK
jgi:hypothetical protein